MASQPMLPRFVPLEGISVVIPSTCLGWPKLEISAKRPDSVVHSIIYDDEKGKVTGVR